VKHWTLLALIYVVVVTACIGGTFWLIRFEVATACLADALHRICR
jgi:hypothetical protein